MPAAGTGIGIACHQQECLFRDFASSFVFYPQNVHAPETIQDEHLFRQAGVRVDQLARPGEGVLGFGRGVPLDRTGRRPEAQIKAEFPAVCAGEGDNDLISSMP